MLISKGTSASSHAQVIRRSPAWGTTATSVDGANADRCSENGVVAPRCPLVVGDNFIGVAVRRRTTCAWDAVRTSKQSTHTLKLSFTTVSPSTYVSACDKL